MSIEVTMRHSDVKIESLKEYAETRMAKLKEKFPKVTKVAIVSVIGSNMKIPGFLARAANALSAAGVNVLAIDQTIRQVNIQFVIEREQFECAQKALHREFVEHQA